ncbi:ABC transporter permease [Salipiger mangrovisoli]|uniref:ABC transporter permease n=1 Tax=Salipiger mangrovisoli TaxID=2865933 RepID=A0ABR9WY47_9RHOB|nr:ABC transporter permease [Salipiger mangrovisoli]MBE9636218.1 ABC transporter permease [Salipiger mangrovisoli]
MTAPNAGEILAAASLVIFCASLSRLLRLGFGRSLLISALRMVLQLVGLAFVLGWLFRTETFLVTLAAMVVMAGFAGAEVVARQEQPPGRLWTGLVGVTAMLTAGLAVTLPALLLLGDDGSWWHPRTALPIFGMVAGASMTGVSLSLDTFAQGVLRDARGIEARLALGATRNEALRPVIRQAVTRGMMPTINAMAAIGVVTIPGMMTGQLLAGAEVFGAARLQMFLMFLLAGATALGTLGATYAMAQRVTDARHRLRLDRLAVRK